MPDGLLGKTVERESKGLSNDNIKPPIAANNSLSAKLKWLNY